MTSKVGERAGPYDSSYDCAAELKKLSGEFKLPGDPRPLSPAGNTGDPMRSLAAELYGIVPEAPIGASPRSQLKPCRNKPL